MHAQTALFRLASPSGLVFQLHAHGAVHRVDHGDLLVNLFPGNALEGGPATIYLRRLGTTTEAIPLLGPQGVGTVRQDERGVWIEGAWQELRFTVALVLAAQAPAWFWHIALENTGDEPVTVDLIYAQDIGLAHYWAVRLNEYYVSQYVDHTPLASPERGWVLASRQNQAMGGRYPWSVVGSLGRAVGYATDALQVHGLASRAGQMPVGVVEGLPGRRLQHEHSLAAIQDEAVSLAPGETCQRGFFGGIVADHPAATGAADLAIVARLLTLPEAVAPALNTAAAAQAQSAEANLFSTAPLLESLDLSDSELATLIGSDWREVERDDDGRLLSCFVGTRCHVALKAKELQILRPHGHMLRSGSALTPDESALTSTTWMNGVFHSMVTQGHVSINRFLSTTHSYLSLFRTHGQRVFVELADGWRLLDVPSAYEMAPEGCRWFYRHAGGLIQVSSTATLEHHELGLAVEVLSGPPLRFLISHHVALNGDDGANALPVQFAQDGEGFRVWAVADSDVGRRFPAGGFRIDPLPGTVIAQAGGDELLFADGRSRQQPFLCLQVAPTVAFGLRLRGELVPATVALNPHLDANRYWSAMTAGLRVEPPATSELAGDMARLAEILPWFAHNALIHYLSPRGLEQYSGGGWGTRDVTQGPVEMLLALGNPEPVRDILLRVFAAQNPDGDWPQWFMFFDRERTIRPGDSHGDIVFWPLLALGHYLLATEDASLLEQPVPFFHPDGAAPAEPLRVHLERALAVIQTRRIPGTHLAAYGHGDWNDSLQPADPAMRERLCSAWTVTLHYQVLTTLAAAFQRLGLDAAEFTATAVTVREDFQRLLVVDGVLTGYAYFHEDGRIDYLLHPQDQNTGLAYSALAMIHAIGNDLFTPEQAAHHLRLIEKHLLGPDGVRLFDRPMRYQGGPQTYFQRAESSTYFGREIGLMYTHAHLRYAEALARHGEAEALFAALCKAHPIGLQARVPTARARQANCYYSSSDADFADRYEAQNEYGRVMRGGVAFEGGWRVYSSGAGIGLGLILRRLLGLRQEKTRLVLDPVLPPRLDGLRLELELAGHLVTVVYAIGTRGYGPESVRLNGAELAFSREANPYRLGGAEIAMADFVARLSDGGNDLLITIG